MHMQLVTDSQKLPPVAGANVAEASALISQSAYPEYMIIRRNGAVVGFDPGKISVAMTKAFLAIEGGQGAASARIRELVAALSEGVVAALARRQPGGGTFHIEDIQDQLYPGASNPFPWMSEMTDLKKERNFFETRVIEYQ